MSAHHRLHCFSQVSCTGWMLRTDEGGDGRGRRRTGRLDAWGPGTPGVGCFERCVLVGGSRAGPLAARRLSRIAPLRLQQALATLLALVGKI